LVFLRNSWLIILSSIGGYILALTGMSLGWLIGSLVFACILSLWHPKWCGIIKEDHTGLPSYWRWMGQFILGIELGRKITASVVDIFLDHWVIVLITLILSILFSFLSGLILWRFSQTDLMTSLFGTAPGGLSSMPSIADEIGANTLVVSIVQTSRILLVLLIIPFMIHVLQLDHFITTPSVWNYARTVPTDVSSLLWTVVIVIGAWLGYLVGKLIKIPAPWLVGAMLGVCLIQSLTSVYLGHELIIFWPHWLINLSQVFIGASIGSRLNKQMFTGIGKIAVVGLVSSLCLILLMFLLAWIVSITADIPLVTTVLAFAPGGIAEMATISVLIHADVGFVVTVQVLRILVVLLMLPPIFKLVGKRVLREKYK
jgi:membrane AbrB-like protein